MKGALRILDTKPPARQRNFASIKVGSVEKFQGDERDIIIVTTVRSTESNLGHDKRYNLGFVKNQKVGVAL